MVAIDSQTNVFLNGNSQPINREQIVNIFSSHHRFTSERLRWVCGWLAKNQLNGKEEFCINRWRFLTAAWGNSIFRPFDDIESSVRHLSTTPDCDFLIRLSTSQPGKITVTHKRKDKIYHTRFTIKENGIRGTTGKTYRDIEHLSQAIAQTLKTRLEDEKKTISVLNYTSQM